MDAETFALFPLYRNKSAPAPPSKNYTKLMELFCHPGWGTDIELVQQALTIFQQNPKVAKEFKPAVHEHGHDPGQPLQAFLSYHAHLSVDDLEFLVSLRPNVLKEYEFLHHVCDKPGVRNKVILFFAERMTCDIQRPARCYTSNMPNQYAIKERPLSLFWIQHARAASLESANSDYWKGIFEVCDVLWFDDRDDFVDVAVEQECWPLIQYFNTKKPKRYWAQEDPEEAWKHSPPNGRITQGAIDLIDKLILPNFKRKAFEVELPTTAWEAEIIPNFIRDHPDLKLIYLHSRDLDNNDYWVPSTITNVIFDALVQNQSLDDFRMSGQFQASWQAFINFLYNAPKETLVCNLQLDTGFDPAIDPVPTALAAANSNITKLDMFRVSFVDANSFRYFMRVVENLPKLTHLEIAMDEDDVEGEEGLDEYNCTDAIVRVLNQNRLKRLAFGNHSLSLLAISNLLRHNNVLESLHTYLHAKKPEDYSHFLQTMKDFNQTLKDYGYYEFNGPPKGVDYSMNGLKEKIVYFTNLNRLNHGVLGSMNAAKKDLLGLLLEARTLVAQDGKKEMEVSYTFELLQKRPSLWADVEARGIKRKLSP